MKWMFIATIAVLSGAALLASRKLQNHDQMFRYIITETGRPTSLDPLMADLTENLSVARMIYATPLEVNTQGNLSSKVLQNFVYDPKSMTMTWTVRDGIQYSDGSTITPSDIAFAVARMAYVRPGFPVIENILGVRPWSKLKDGLQSLPEGISVDGSRITIKFDKPQDHPLFRFCLEIFSVIPKRCVNLSTNKVICDPIPSSGNYTIGRETPEFIDFEISGNGKIHDALAPRHIRFEYMLPKEVVTPKAGVNSNTIIAGNEIRFSPDALGTLREKSSTVFAPAARIGILLLNPTGVFKDKTCRRVFADSYRAAFSTLSKGQMQNEASLFTDILPGFMKNDELASSSPISDTEKNRCVEAFRKNGISWARAKKEDSSALFDEVALQAFRLLKMNDTPTFEVDSRYEVTDAFTEGRVSFLTISTGFWALDPAGDVQMLLTPNMHKMLHVVAGDNKVQELIRGLKTSTDTASAYRKLNQYLYDEALFNVFAHVRRFYASPNRDLIAELPISVSSPAPWQVFKVVNE